MGNQALVTTSSQDSYLAMADDLACGLSLPLKVQIGSRYLNADRIKAVTLYIVVGKLAEVSRLLDIPWSTLRDWKLTEWWAELTTSLRQLKSDLLEARTDNIISMAFDNVEERLTQGDYATYDSKAQEIIYKPVSCKDSATVFGIMFDKRQISRALPTSISQSTTTHLIDIKAQFEAMTQGRTIEHDDSN